MSEGFYWVEYAGQKVIAWFSLEETRHHVTSKLVTGVWHLGGSNGGMATDDEVRVLEGPLQPPRDSIG